MDPNYPPKNRPPIVIVGAGAGGLATALAVATHGQRVILIDIASRCGGTVSHALIHTLGGFLDSEGQLVNAGLSAELLERLQAASPQTIKRQMGKLWVLNVDPAVYERTVQSWLQETTLVQFLPHSTMTHLTTRVKDGEAGIRAVILQTPDGKIEHDVSAVVDATGHATVVRQLDAQKVTESAALAGFIVQLRGVEADSLRFPKGIALLRTIRKAAAEHRLPAECATVWLDSGVFPDEIYLKFNFALATWKAPRMHGVAQALLEFLRHQVGFATALIHHYGDVGIRNGGQIKGRYCLTEDDIKSGRLFEDIACYGCWPIEHWHLSKGIELEYFPPGHRYAIPLRSLQLADFSNLWVAGKCLSAEPRVQASARVVGTCWAMGEAVGTHLAHPALESKSSELGTMSPSRPKSYDLDSNSA